MTQYKLVGLHSPSCLFGTTCIETVGELNHSSNYTGLKSPVLLNVCRSAGWWQPPLALMDARLPAWPVRLDLNLPSSSWRDVCSPLLLCAELCPSFHCTLLCKMGSAEASVPFCLARKRPERCQQGREYKELNCSLLKNWWEGGKIHCRYLHMANTDGVSAFSPLGMNIIKLTV